MVESVIGEGRINCPGYEELLLSELTNSSGPVVGKRFGAGLGPTW